MRDGIISEQMKSRLIKAGLPATYEELVALAADTGIPADILINEDGWQQLPTYLSKANLLSDATEVAIWETAQNRTVNDALKMLADVAYGRVASLTLTIKDTAGNPIPDVTVRLDSAPTVGTDPTTGTDGKIKFDTNAGSHTVYLVYPLGYSAETGSTTVQVTGNTAITVQSVSRKAESTIFNLTEAKVFYIARFLSPVQFDIRGGGGSGCAVAVSGKSSSNEGGGQGGAGGYVNITGAVDVAGKLIRISPGSGGNPASTRFPSSSSTSPGNSSDGKRGGTTTLRVDDAAYQASGGAGGTSIVGTTYKKLSRNTDGGAAGGNNAGPGYAAEAKGEDGRYLFDDSTQARKGSGGGGANVDNEGHIFSGSAGEGGGTSGQSDDSGSYYDDYTGSNASNASGSGAVCASRSAGAQANVISGKGGPGFVAFRKAV